MRKQFLFNRKKKSGIMFSGPRCVLKAGELGGTTEKRKRREMTQTPGVWLKMIAQCIEEKKGVCVWRAA